MKTVIIVLLGLCLVNVWAQINLDFIEIQRHFEFEEILDENQTEYWVWRSEASALKTLRLEDMTGQHKIFFSLCLDPMDPEKNVTVRIANIRYSNDGPEDVGYASLNGQLFSVFYTSEQWGSGHEWNVFRNTGQIGREMALPNGTYELGIKVETDKSGVEFDRIEVNAGNQNALSNIFCGAKLITLNPLSRKNEV